MPAICQGFIGLDYEKVAGFVWQEVAFVAASFLGLNL